MSRHPASHPARTSLIIAALVAAMSVAACDRAERQQKSAEVKQQANTAKQAIDDATITTKVKAALATETNLKSTGISVDTVQGKVTLSGSVPDKAQLDRAAQIARSVEGVQEVNNRLTAGTT